MACLFGLGLSLVGYDPVLGVPRFTGGVQYLEDGVGLIPLFVGMFGVSEAIKMFMRGRVIAKTGKLTGNLWEGFGATLRNYKILAMSTVMGIVIGILPGIGGTAANLLAYSLAQKNSPDPDSFGKGNVQGVIAAETANNSIEGGALIPTPTLGIPGSISAALILTAMIIQGLTPGRQLFESKSDIVWAFFVGLLVGHFVVLAVSIVFMRWLSLVTLIPNEILAVAVLSLSFVGIYSLDGSLNGIVVAVTAGILAYFVNQAQYPIVGFVVGVILGPGMERSFHQSLQMSGGSFAIFFNRPFCLVFIALILLIVLMEYRKDIAQMLARRAA